MTDHSEPVADDTPGGGARTERSTILHIGTMKSGTSYLQDMLERNRGPLRTAGVRYMGRGTRAVWDVLDLRTDRPAHKGAWGELVREMTKATEPTRVLSMEILSTASDEQVRNVVASLGPDPVEVIITARDLARTIPSAWQNAVKHGGRPPFADFVAAVMDPSEERPNGPRFWRQHGLVRIVNRWAAAVGPTRVHLLTLPAAGASPDILWQRFCSVLGVDADDYATDADRAGNASLSFSDAELLRQLNRRLDGELGLPGYNRYVRDFLAHEVMRTTPEPELADADKPVLDAAAQRWARRRGEQMTRAIATSGVHVVGDLRDLVPDESTTGSGSDRGGTPAVTYPETAVRAMAMLLRRLTALDPATSAAQPSPADLQAKRRVQRRRRTLDAQSDS
jgi:hypothetical protein